LPETITTVRELQLSLHPFVCKDTIIIHLLQYQIFGILKYLLVAIAHLMKMLLLCMNIAIGM